MSLDNIWVNKKLIFFGGKGGVGKTTFSAALSVYLSRQKSKNVLLISTDPAHNLSDIFQKRLKKNITKIGSGLSVLELDPDHEAEKYLKSVKTNMQQNVHAKLFPQVNDYLKLAKLSPGLSEAALLDSLSELIVGNYLKYDHIIIDTAPTGHTLRLVLLPETMKNWVDLLINKREANIKISKLWNDKKSEGDRLLRILESRRKKFTRLKQLIIDPEITTFNFIMNPDHFSFEETKRGVLELEKGNIQVNNFIVNKIIATTLDTQFINYEAEQKETLLKIHKWGKKKNIMYSPWHSQRILGIDSLFEFASIFE